MRNKKVSRLISWERSDAVSQPRFLKIHNSYFRPLDLNFSWPNNHFNYDWISIPTFFFEAFSERRLLHLPTSKFFGGLCFPIPPLSLHNFFLQATRSGIPLRRSQKKCYSVLWYNGFDASLEVAFVNCIPVLFQKRKTKPTTSNKLAWRKKQTPLCGQNLART